MLRSLPDLPLRRQSLATVFPVVTVAGAARVPAAIGSTAIPGEEPEWLVRATLAAVLRPITEQGSTGYEAHGCHRSTTIFISTGTACQRGQAILMRRCSAITRYHSVSRGP